MRRNSMTNNKEVKGRKGAFVSLQEAARVLNLTKHEVQILIKEERLQAELISNKYKFRLKELEEFIGKGTRVNDQNAVKWDTQSLERKGAMQVRGSISSTQNGDYIVQFSNGKDPVTGKRRRVSKRFRSKEAAEAYRLEVNMQQAERRQDKTFGEHTFSEFATHYLHINPNGATSRTLDGYHSELVAVNAVIGGVKLKDLTEQMIKKCFEGLSKEYAQSVLTKKWTVMRMVLKYATAKGYIETNPTTLLKKPKSRKMVYKDRDSKIYKDNELKQIFKAASNDLELLTMFQLLHTTGMRPSELRALRWEDYDADSQSIKIKSAISRDYDKEGLGTDNNKYTEVVSTTKTEKGVRTVYLHDNALNALNKWREKVQKSNTRQIRESIYIFPGRDGNFMKEKTFSNKFYRFSKQNGFLDIGIQPYKFRHTYCTNLVLTNVPIASIKNLMGDKTDKIIMEVYTHIDKNKDKEYAANMFDQIQKY